VLGNGGCTNDKCKANKQWDEKELRNPTTMGFRNLTCIAFTLNSRKLQFAILPLHAIRKGYYDMSFLESEEQ